GEGRSGLAAAAFQQIHREHFHGIWSRSGGPPRRGERSRIQARSRSPAAGSFEDRGARRCAPPYAGTRGFAAAFDSGWGCYENSVSVVWILNGFRGRPTCTAPRVAIPSSRDLQDESSWAR